MPEQTRADKRFQVSMPTSEYERLKAASADEYDGNVSLMVRMLFRKWWKNREKSRNNC